MWIDKQKTINLQLEMPVRLSTYRKGNAIPPLPGTNIFHSTELFHVFEMTRGYEPLLIVAYIGNRPVGKLLAVIRKSVRLFPPAIIKRCEIYGTGEYFDEEQNKEDLFGEILEHLTNEVLCKSFLIEFRNLENPLFGYKAFRKNNYFAINWLRVRNSLHSKAPYERLSMSRRRQINKALRNGAIMEIADNEKDIQDFSRMLKKAYSSQIRKHFPDIGFFRLLAWQNPEKELAKSSVVLSAFSQKKVPTCGSQEACGKPMLFFTPVFWPYGHLLPMLTKKDMHIWNSWMQDYRSKSTVTGTLYSALAASRAVHAAGSASVGSG